MNDLVTIRRPVQQVFAFVTDHAHDRLWKPFVVESRQTSPGPIGVGTLFRVVAATWIFRSAGVVEVVEYEPYRGYPYKIHARLFPLIAHLAFEPVEGGTRIWGQVELPPHHVLGALSAILLRIIQDQSRPTFARLRDVMESQPTALDASQESG